MDRKRLIDAYVLNSELIERQYRDQTMGILHSPYPHLRAIVANQPTVDAVEVPPVKIGDTAYFIINKKIYEAEIVLISWCQNRYGATTEIRGEVQKNHTVSSSFFEWNKNVFAARQQAEEVLAKGHGGINDNDNK